MNLPKLLKHINRFESSKNDNKNSIYILYYKRNQGNTPNSSKERNSSAGS